MTTWTPTEHQLADHLANGTTLNLADRPNEEHTVRADAIRTLLLGRRLRPTSSTESDTNEDTAWIDAPADPRGVQLHGAAIEGRLDLDHLTTNTRLALNHCTIPDGITAYQATLKGGLDLDHSNLGHPELELSGLGISDSGPS